MVFTGSYFRGFVYLLCLTGFDCLCFVWWLILLLLLCSCGWLICVCLRGWFGMFNSVD